MGGSARRWLVGRALAGRLGATAVVIVIFALLAAGSSRAARAQADAVGYDVSYPQCNQTLPSGAAFAIVGVNAGLPFSPNPCLGTADGPSELQWAGVNAELYANTADPGPTLSSHWPNGQTTPQQCDTSAAPGADTSTCAYDYGWNAAQNSYQDAVAAYVALGWASAGSTRTPVANIWWLDVESDNSWEANAANNVAELQGEVDSLKSVGAASVGFYAPSDAWSTITDATTQFASSPFWLPGATSSTDAEARCGSSAPDGGAVSLTQFAAGSYGADIDCSTVPTLRIMTGAQTLAAGKPSAPFVIQLSQAPSSPATISLSSSSPTGQFAASIAGPWTSAATLPVAADGTQAAPFYYRDTTPGTAIVTVTLAGYASATQSETITPARTTQPVCIRPPAHDRGYELVLAHTHTQTAATHLLRSIDRQARPRYLRALIERHGCTDFEVAITGFRNRATALQAMRHARHQFHHAALEHP